jgi:uncharacterized membrane protein YbhN (UPF0104 family)
MGNAPGQDVAAPPRRSAWRVVVSAAITVAVLVVVFVGIFPKFADYSDAWSSIQQVPTAYLVALAVATVATSRCTCGPCRRPCPG